MPLRLGSNTCRHIAYAPPLLVPVPLRPQSVMSRFGLRQAAGAEPQTYALGIKEVRVTGACACRIRPLSLPFLHALPHKFPCCPLITTRCACPLPSRFTRTPAISCCLCHPDAIPTPELCSRTERATISRVPCPCVTATSERLRCVYRHVCMPYATLQVWQVPEAQHSPGTVVHTIGYPASGG